MKPLLKQSGFRQIDQELWHSDRLVLTLKAVRSDPG
jgi:hypothetical protein